MFERLTNAARRVVVLSQEEARSLGHQRIGTEHLLLGLLREERGLAAEALTSSGLSLEDGRASVLRILGRGEPFEARHIPFTQQAKEVLEQSLREAIKLEHAYIGTEHVLLGLLHEPDSMAAKVLAAAGIERPAVRRRVADLLASYSPRPEPGSGRDFGSESDAVVGPQEIDYRLAQIRSLTGWAIDRQFFDVAAGLSVVERMLLEVKLADELGHGETE
jgi:ATP-dependent Clp protease ATP-binding subunit ClpC